MDFKKATDQLCEKVTAADIAKALKKPEQSIRQARVDPDSAGYRAPPDRWREAVIKLAEDRAARLSALAAKLRAETSG